MFLHAARHGELDELRGVSSNIMCGQEGYFGTSAFQTYIDNDLMVKLQKERNHKTYNLGKEMNEKNIEKIMDNLMADDESSSMCSINNLKKQNVLNTLAATNNEIMEDDEYELDL